MDSLDLESLDIHIDNLESSLRPFIKNTLAASTSKLPLLDRAKIYVLIVYAVEATLFSYVRLHGVEAKEHPVFRELTRVKQYFQKIKVAEEPLVGPKMRLDQNAATRFIKHALSPAETGHIVSKELASSSSDQVSKGPKRKRASLPVNLDQGVSAGFIPVGASLPPEAQNAGASIINNPIAPDRKKSKKRTRTGKADPNYG